MNKKTLNVLYWIVTIIFCLANLLTGIPGLFPTQEGIAAMAHLGYPAYLIVFLSVAKILGSVAVIQNKFKTIKEWAYAGFAFDYIGAGVSIYVVDGIGMTWLPAIFLVVLFASYWLWKKRK